MITVTRMSTNATRHSISIRDHKLITDMLPGDGGVDEGPDPHDLYDSALGACKALTVLWYAQRHKLPLEDIEVFVERDNREERQGTYRLKTTLKLGGPLDEGQRKILLGVAGKCPVHKLMSEVTTEITTELAP